MLEFLHSSINSTIVSASLPETIAISRIYPTEKAVRVSPKNVNYMFLKCHVQNQRVGAQFFPEILNCHFLTYPVKFSLIILMKNVTKYPFTADNAQVHPINL